MDSPVLDFEKKKLSDRVLDQIMSWIMDGEIQMGEKLNTDELAKKLSVSRMPVREAIKVIERKGLIESVPYCGSRLVVLTKHDIKQLYIMRGQLEPIAGYYACKDATEEDIRKAKNIISEFEMIVNSGNSTAKEIYTYNRLFHFSLYECSHMDRLVDMIAQIWDNLAFCKLIFGQTYVTDPKMMEKQISDHRLYLKLLIERDAEGLQEVLSNNLDQLKYTMPEIADTFLEK
ncbi:MAG: GntR family transcriptional regulator [Sphaerochaeta sp.]